MKLRYLSGLTKEEEESQVNTLIYAMGDQADDTLTSFKLTITQLKQYHAVKIFMSILRFREILIPSEQNSNRAAKKMTRLLKHLLQRCTRSPNTAIMEPWRTRWSETGL